MDVDSNVAGLDQLHSESGLLMPSAGSDEIDTMPGLRIGVIDSCAKSNIPGPEIHTEIATVIQPTLTRRQAKRKRDSRRKKKLLSEVQPEREARRRGPVWA